MAIKYFVFQALTGGAAGALDAIDDSVLTDLDMAIGVDGSDVSYLYQYDAGSILAEDSPKVIAPDTGTGRWILQPAYGLPSTTVMLFGQSAAPTGWTKKVDWQDQSMIVYTTGNIAQGGAVDAKAAHQHGAFTLAIAEIASHLHNINAGAAGQGSSGLFVFDFIDWDITELTGGGGSHQHTANTAPYYCSVIAATKD